LLEEQNPNDVLFKIKDPINTSKPKKNENFQYKSINEYKPSGNLVYDDDILNKIEGKFFK
jgi:hypothetical protein